MRQTNRGLASIQDRYCSLFRQTPNQKDNKSKVPTTEFLVTALQKDRLLNNTIIKNIELLTLISIKFAPKKMEFYTKNAFFWDRSIDKRRGLDQ